jgi:hypothetical protein
MKKVVLIILSILVLLLAFFLVQRSRNPECKSFLLLGYQRSHNQPEEIARSLISELGGLPKSDMDIHEAIELLEHNAPLPVYPVQKWQILTTSAMNPGKHAGSFFDTESTYNLNFRMQVSYADGDEAILQWFSWSYGFVVCPFIVSTGTGPPGHLKLIR